VSIYSDNSKMKNIKQLLYDFGLSPVETEVYLILLQLGSTPVSTIAKKGHIKRTNIYNVLTKLKERGIVSEFQKGHVRFFQATEVQRLIYLQEQKKNKIEQNVELLQEMLPVLQSMQNPYLIKPKVRFYEGSEGIGNLLEEILNNESYDSYFNPEVAYKNFPDIMDDFQRNAAKKKNKIRELIVQSAETNKYIKKIKSPYHHYKILPKKYFCANDNFVYGDFVAYISYLEGNIAVVIESAEIARAQKMSFQMMWDAVK